MPTTAYQSAYTGAQIDAAVGAVPSKADKIAEVNHGTSDTTFTLTANTMHIWGTVSSLTLSLPTDSNSYLDEYLITFTSGSTPTTLSLPSTVKWVQELSVEANKTYQVSIINNLAGWLTNDMPSGGGSGGGGENNVIESISVNSVAQTVDANKNVNLQFKTINNESISGTGNISISGGGGEANVIESISVNNVAQTVTNKNVNITVPTKVSDLTNDSGYTTSADLADYLPLSGGTMTGNITANNILLPNQKAIQVADSNGTYGSALSMTSNDNLMLGRSTVGSTVVVGNNSVILRVGDSSSTGDALTIDSSKNTNLKGNLALPNNYSVLINDTQGNAQNAIKLDGSNHVVVGYSNPVDISGNTSITGTASVSSNLSVSGTSTLDGYVYMPYENRLYFKSSGNTNMIAMYQTAANHLYIGYGFADNGYSTYVAGNTVELRYGASRTTGLTLGSTGNVTVGGDVSAGSFTGDLTGNASSATKLSTPRSIWGQDFDGSSYVRGTLSMFPDTLGMNNDTAKLWFRSNTSSSGDGYSPYIQGIYQAGTGRKRLSVFQINDGSSYTSTHNEVFTILPDGKVGIGTVSPSSLLDVNGNVSITGSLSIGGNAVVAVYSGSSAPSSSTGSNGDIYIQTTT